MLNESLQREFIILPREFTHARGVGFPSAPGVMAITVGRVRVPTPSRAVAASAPLETPICIVVSLVRAGPADTSIRCRTILAGTIIIVFIIIHTHIAPSESDRAPLRPSGYSLVKPIGIVIRRGQVIIPIKERMIFM